MIAGLWCSAMELLVTDCWKTTVKLLWPIVTNGRENTRRWRPRCFEQAASPRELTMPKEKPKVNIGEVIKSYRSGRGLSQGDIEKRTGLLRCYLSRVENGHTVPSLETLAKIAEALDMSLAEFFPGTDTAQDRETRKALGELSEEEIRFLAEIKKYSTSLSEDDKKLVLAMIRKMAAAPPSTRQASVARRPNGA
jgi:transcriptional regulator with XRE-family HTH domain